MCTLIDSAADYSKSSNLRHIASCSGDRTPESRSIGDGGGGGQGGFLGGHLSGFPPPGFGLSSGGGGGGGAQQLPEASAA